LDKNQQEFIETLLHQDLLDFQKLVNNKEISRDHLIESFSLLTSKVEKVSNLLKQIYLISLENNTKVEVMNNNIELTVIYSNQSLWKRFEVKLSIDVDNYENIKFLSFKNTIGETKHLLILQLFEENSIKKGNIYTFWSLLQHQLFSNT